MNQSTSLQYMDQDYIDNIKYLNMVNDLYKGTREINNQGKTYLYPFQNEDDESYERRLKDSDFYNFFRKSVDNYSGILLRKPPMIDTKARNKRYLDNINGKGSSLNMFLKEVSKAALIDGMAYLWVDSQRVNSDLTLSDIESLAPYIKLVKRSDVLSKKIAFVNGQAVLKQIIIRQVIQEEKSDYTNEEKEIQIIIKENGGTIMKDGSIVDSWESGLGFVPVVPVYSAKTDFLEADIPLLDLGYANLSHYNRSSELTSYIRISSVPVPVLYTSNEFQKETLTREGVTIGATTALVFGNRNEQGFEYKEITGSSLNPLKENIKDIELRMEKLALSALTNFNTATEAVISESNNNMFLQELSFSLEDAINTCFEIMNEYLGINLGVKIELNKDFNSIGLDANTIQQYIQLKQAGLMSLDTLWEALKKGEVINIEDFDLEKQKIAEESFSMPTPQVNQF